MRFGLFIAILFLAGCATDYRHTEPKNNNEFRNISDIHELVGVYVNKGDPSGYLTGIIWEGYGGLKTNSGEVPHANVTFVEVSIIKNTLIAKAIKDNCSIIEKSYDIGRDIDVSGGVITLNMEAKLLNGRGMVLGPSFRNDTLGLDSDNHGKHKTSYYEAGLYIFVPVSSSDTDEVRYLRTSDNPTGYKDCTIR